MASGRLGCEDGSSKRERSHHEADYLHRTCRRSRACRHPGRRSHPPACVSALAPGARPVGRALRKPGRLRARAELALKDRGALHPRQGPRGGVRGHGGAPPGVLSGPPAAGPQRARNPKRPGASDPQRARNPKRLEASDPQRARYSKRPRPRDCAASAAGCQTRRPAPAGRACR